MKSNTLTLLSGVSLALAIQAGAKPTVACFIETPVRSTSIFGVKYRFADTGGYSYGIPTDLNTRWADPSFTEYHMREIQEAGVDVVIVDGTNWGVTVNANNGYGNTNSEAVPNVENQCNRRNMQLAFLVRGQRANDVGDGFTTSIADANERAKVIYLKSVKKPDGTTNKPSYFWITTNNKVDLTQGLPGAKPLLLIWHPNNHMAYDDAYAAWVGTIPSSENYLKFFHVELSYAHDGWGWEYDSTNEVVTNGVVTSLASVKFIKASNPGTGPGAVFPFDNVKKTDAEWGAALNWVMQASPTVPTKIAIVSNYDGTGDCALWADHDATNLINGDIPTTSDFYREGNKNSGPLYYNKVKFKCAASLVTPWANRDIGIANDPDVSGNVGRFTELDGSVTWTVNGGGSDLMGTQDKLNFSSLPKTGNFTITAKLMSLDGPNSLAKAGLMVREATTPGAREFSVIVGSTGDVSCLARTTASSPAVSYTNTANITEPCWMRITRVGNVFTAFAAPNSAAVPTNAQWTQIKALTIGMNTTVNPGLAVSSRQAALNSTARFNNVSVP